MSHTDATQHESCILFSDPYYSDIPVESRFNSTTCKKMYLRQRCSVKEFKGLFPKAKAIPRSIIDLEDLTYDERNKYVPSYKMYHMKFGTVRDLDYLFGHIPNWDVVVHGKSVGFILPMIEFRLVITEINSFKTPLSDDPIIANTAEYSFVQQHSTLSISFFRGACTRWGSVDPATKKNKEANWKERVLYFQKNNLTICKRRLAHRTVKCK
jgi:hypothetical protein